MWWIFALVLGTYGTLCAGFPQIAVMNLYFATAYALFRAAPHLKNRFKTGLGMLGLAAAGIFLGLLLSGVQLFPSIEMGTSKDSTRVLATLDQIQEKPLHPLCLATYISPDLFGHPDLTRETVSTYYDSLLELALLPKRPDINYVEIHGYVGLIPFILALLVMVAGARKGWKFFAACLAFCLLTALSVPGIIHLTSILPGLMVGDIKRFIFPATACLSILSAFTLDAFWKQKVAPKVRITGLAVLIALVALVAASWIGLTQGSEESLKETVASAIHRNTGLDMQAIRSAITDEDLRTQRAHLAGVLLRTLLFLGLTAAALVLNSGKYRDWPVSHPLIVAVLVLDLFGTGWRFNRPMPGELPLYDETNPAVHFLKENTGLQRIIRYQENLIYPVNSGVVNGIHDAQGYTAFYFKRYRHLLDQLEEGRSDAYGMFCLTSERALESPVLDCMAVKYVLSPVKLDLPGLREAFHSRSVWIYENLNSLPRAYLQTKAVFADSEEEAAGLVGSSAFDPRTEVVIEGAHAGKTASESGSFQPQLISVYEEERIEVDVKGGPGLLVLCDAFCKDWTAELDGKPVTIHPANLAYRAVEIPDGSSHKLAFTYRPKAFKIGAWVSLTGLLLCMMLAGLFFYRYRIISRRDAC